MRIGPFLLYHPAFSQCNGSCFNHFLGYQSVSFSALLTRLLIQLFNHGPDAGHHYEELAIVVNKLVVIRALALNICPVSNAHPVLHQPCTSYPRHIWTLYARRPLSKLSNRDEIVTAGGRASNMRSSCMKTKVHSLENFQYFFSSHVNA
jgi:hypothetical protein